MKKTFFIMLLANLFLTQAYCLEKLENITIESLAKDPHEEHVVCMQTILQTLHVRNMLELGVGYATKTFLDSCKRVVSVEFVTNGYGPANIREFIQLYRDFSNWVPIAYFSGYRGDMSWAPYKYVGSDAVYTAGSYSCATHLSYEAIDGSYLKELGVFLTNLVKYNKIEVALIHANVYLRGDLVNLCFEKIPVIVAHDTNWRLYWEKNDPWGYSRLQTPSGYVEIQIPTSRGTTVWVSNKPEFQALINNLLQLQTK